MIDQALFMIQSLYLSIMIVISLTIVGFALLEIFNNKFSRGSKFMQIQGLFIGLTLKEQIMLSVSAIKLFFIISMLVQINKIELVHYVALCELAIANCALRLPSLFSFKALAYDAAIVGSCFLLNVICSYIDSINSSFAFTVIVISACIFVLIFAYYRFIDEISNITKNKKVELTNEEAN